MSELDELRQKRLRELMMMQQTQQERIQEQFKAEEINKQIGIIIQQIMTPEARERLGNIRAARPDFARQVEILLIQLYQAGRLPNRIDDALLKEILAKISSKKHEITIKK
jgi:programmed cell death protein 5